MEKSLVEEGKENFVLLIEKAEKDPEDNELFRQVVTQGLSFFETIRIANALSVATTTVLRWGNGKAFPHPLMRKPVYSVLKRFIKGELP